MKRTLIHNATIVNEGQSVQGSVVIENGRIAEVLINWKPLSAPCEEVIDATGCYLLPGIIDDHVHFRDPGLTHKADILTESRAAAAGRGDFHYGHAQYQSADRNVGCLECQTRLAE